jgi:hypothetical protein
MVGGDRACRRRDSLLPLTEEMSVFEQTLLGAAVGAACAMAAGLGAVRYQYRLAVKVARRLRLDQRREEGLLLAIQALGELMFQIENILTEHERSPDALFQTSRWIAAEQSLRELGRQWQDSVEFAVDQRTKAAYRRVIDQWRQAETVLDANNPPPPEFWDALRTLPRRSASLRGQRILSYGKGDSIVGRPLIVDELLALGKSGVRS